MRNDMGTFLRGVVGVALSLGLALGAALAEEKGQAKETDILGAVVKLRAKALPDARTASTLGQNREGSGVVIDSDGLVLTIGYLILEAEGIEVTGADGKTLPANLVGYDHATGFGLVRTVAPLAVRPLALGDSSTLEERDVALIAGHGGREGANIGYVVSRREFTGSWEYLVEDAIFTAPAVYNWGGAALIGPDGRLVGIGSLYVRDAARPGSLFPGNMFVPINLLKPILGDLIASGRSGEPPRPWLGLGTEEVQGRLFVTRIQPEGPSDQAGIRAGDMVIGVNGVSVQGQADFYRRLWKLGAAGTEVKLQVLQGVKVNELAVKSIDRLNYLRTRSAY